MNSKKKKLYKSLRHEKIARISNNWKHEIRNDEVSPCAWFQELDADDKRYF